MYFNKYKADFVWAAIYRYTFALGECKNSYLFCTFLVCLLFCFFTKTKSRQKIKSTHFVGFTVVLPLAIFHTLLSDDNKSIQNLSCSLWNLQTGTSSSIDSRLPAPAIDALHHKWIVLLFTALKHERILMRQTHAQTAADKDYIVGFSLLGGVCDGKSGSGERWMAAQGRACCISDVKVVAHMHDLKRMRSLSRSAQRHVCSLFFPIHSPHEGHSRLNIVR